MAGKGRSAIGPFVLRVQAGKLFAPSEFAQIIENFIPQEEGTLRSIWGPATYVPLKDPVPQQAGVGDPIETLAPAVGTRPPAYPSTLPSVDLTGIEEQTPVYGKINHGIFHCLLRNGQRDVLLLHTGEELWEFRGWKRNWRRLIAPDATDNFGVKGTLIDDSKARFPTQFEPTGNGVVIVPQRRRAYFYDGQTIAPLGFSEIPNAPTGIGPENSHEKWISAKSGSRGSRYGRGVNDVNYAHDGLYDRAVFDEYGSGTRYSMGFCTTGMTKGFGNSRIGTVGSLSPYDYATLQAGAGSGWLETGEWRCAVQFIDRWGNLSPLSGRSNAVTVETQPASIMTTYDSTDSDNSEFRAVPVSRVQKQFAWIGIPKGPEYCIGRILYRTQDLRNSGTAKLFVLTQNATATSFPFATLPDNVTTIYPDNIPDAWLVDEATEVDPVPRFKLCRVAFGRLWIGNIAGRPGLIRPSLPGLWGTFERGKEIYPDPAGGAITGLWRVNRGLLAFTEKSTFLIEASDDGEGFRSSPLSAEVGCVAPNSIQTLGDGRVVWFGGDSFYAYDGQTVANISKAISRPLRRTTRARMAQACSAFDPRYKEYRCWLSIDGSVENNMCFIYDGEGWRQRTDVSPRDVCVTRDHREYMLAAGRVMGEGDDTDNGTYNGVFLLDHYGNRHDSKLERVLDDREAYIETSWMHAATSREAKTASVVYLWLRETEDSEVTIEVFRDWRNQTTETATAKRYSGEDPPNFWGETTLGEEGAHWVRRRPFWTRVEIYVPSAETFKFKIRGKGSWEFVGLTIDEASRYSGGAMIPS